ncbi:MAG: SH3 domain-containing protein [Actinomycetota bacterium]
MADWKQEYKKCNDNRLCLSEVDAKARGTWFFRMDVLTDGGTNKGSFEVFAFAPTLPELESDAQDEGDLQRCMVSDTTGTRLNIRDLPNGKIIGKLTNGTVVYTENDMYDTKLRNWSEIKLTRRGKAKGWVAREFLDCE